MTEIPTKAFAAVSLRSRHRRQRMIAILVVFACSCLWYSSNRVYRRATVQVDRLTAQENDLLHQAEQEVKTLNGFEAWMSTESKRIDAMQGKQALNDHQKVELASIAREIQHKNGVIDKAQQQINELKQEFTELDVRLHRERNFRSLYSTLSDLGLIGFFIAISHLAIGQRRKRPMRKADESPPTPLPNSDDLHMPASSPLSAGGKAARTPLP